MRKLRITYRQSFYNSPIEQCFYCKRHLSDHNNWTNLQRCNDLFRPSTKLCGNKIRVVVCHTCQRAKSQLEPEEFIEILQGCFDKTKEFKYIAVSQIQTIIRNILYILDHLEPDLNGRNLTVLKRTDSEKPQLKYQAVSSPLSIQPNASQINTSLTCYYCNTPLDITRQDPSRQITRDHVRPLSKHPESRKIVFSCHSCNNSKANDEPEIFLAKLKIANYHKQNYKKIPYHRLCTIIVNLQDLIHKSLKPFAPYPVLSILKCYDLSLLRQQLHREKRQLWLERIDDFVLLELLLLCLSAQNNRSRDGLAHDAAFFNITLWQERLELALEIGWISAFYRIDTIDFHALMEEQEFDQFYILSDRGRAALQLETVCSQQQK
ncbi:hypothetical protein [Sphingobacterium sp. 18053]|uniref:hypothetical protein n=1 Tax=Sphingobacterium sp. 18053 TaxID=2681401 RepID=UPI001359003B|nr:hypothetical protein [Sphingobacterium sp. 18053]